MTQFLSVSQLAQRHRLPEKPAPVSLKGMFVHLEPLVIERDALPLFEISNGAQIQQGEKIFEAFDADNLIWRYMFDGPFQTLESFTASLQAQINAGNGRCFCVFDTQTRRPIGVANYMNNCPAHLKIELGGIWYSPIAQRTHANMETAYLMLNHAFNLGYRRLEWKCHSQNERSRKAALKIGFKFEGIQESHFIVKDCNRDTAWFRLLVNEWPEVSFSLKKRLYPDIDQNV